MGQVRGVVLLAASELAIPVEEYAATHVKRILTGNGRAAKAQIQQAVRIHLGMTKRPHPHDVADALAIALCHFLSIKSPLARDRSNSASIGV